MAEAGDARAVGLAAGGVGRQGVGRLDCGTQALGQHQGIAQAEVEALRGDRVQALGGVADQHHPSLVQAPRVAAQQRPGRGLAGVVQAPQALAEPVLQGVDQGHAALRHDHVRLRRGQGPDHPGPATGQRQGGDRAIVGEALVGDATVRPP